MPTSSVHAGRAPPTRSAKIAKVRCNSEQISAYTAGGAAGAGLEAGSQYQSDVVKAFCEVVPTASSSRMVYSKMRSAFRLL